MVTVGEMVRVQGERVLAELKRECPEALDGPASSLTGLWLQGLRELGLWDAEVLDSEVGLDTDGTLYVCPWGPDNRGWDCRGFEAGQRVRVIVLPAKEE